MVHAGLSSLKLYLLLATLAFVTHAAREKYDVRKIIQSFRQQHDDLIILCAHRGLRWNGTTENSRMAYFRAAQAGLECIETDVRLSSDNQLTMIHDVGIGRETDVGEYVGKEAYNPFTGRGFNPRVRDVPYQGFMEHLHLRDETGRVHDETVPTLPDIIQTIRENDLNVVLQLDFKEKAAVREAYYALKYLTNAAGVPANEWCIYKIQAAWWKTPEEFEALDWVQDAFVNGVQLAYIPVYQPADSWNWNTTASLEAYLRTNYTISAEIELKNTGGPLQDTLDYLRNQNGNDAWTFETSGAFYLGGDLVAPTVANFSFFDTANFSLPADNRVNNSVFTFEDGKPPKLVDWNTGNRSSNGHDTRSDFAWLLSIGHTWIIADTPDEWHQRLSEQGKRNTSYFFSDETALQNGTVAATWYRRHARSFSP